MCIFALSFLPFFKVKCRFQEVELLNPKYSQFFIF